LFTDCRVIYCSETGTVIVLENAGGPLGIHVVPGVDKFGRYRLAEIWIEAQFCSPPI